MDQTQAQAWAEQRCCPQKKRPMLVMMCRSSAIKAEGLGSTATRSTAASNGQTEARCGKGSFHVLVPGATGIVSLFVSDSELCAGEMKQLRFCEGKIKSCLNRHLCDLCQSTLAMILIS